MSPNDVPGPIDVREIRRRMNISRQQFAECFRIPVATLRHWENGERRPRGTALILLHVIARNPQAVVKALRAWEFKRAHPLPEGLLPVTRRKPEPGPGPRREWDD